MSVLFYGGTVSGGFAVLILLVTTGIAVLAYWARTRRGRPHPLVLAAATLGTLGLAVVLVVTLLQWSLWTDVPTRMRNRCYFRPEGRR